MPIRRRIGPFTITTGPTGIVVASTPWMLNWSVQTASTAASTAGRYSGRQPALTALIATFSPRARREQRVALVFDGPERDPPRRELVSLEAHRELGRDVRIDALRPTTGAPL